MDTPTASTIAQSGWTTADWHSQVDQQADGAAEQHTDDASRAGEHHASVRNCQMTSRRRAPMPCEHRSRGCAAVTDISMMFITPTPPTRSPIRADSEDQTATDAVIWRN